MGNSLFDQLKNSGLVDEKKAKKAKQSQYKSIKQQSKKKKGSPAPVDEAALLAQEAQAKKVERDRMLNQQRKDAAEQKAVAAQIKQLIESNRVTERDGDVAYNFTDGSAVKRLHVSEQVHKSLSNGRLVIAKLGAGYELVPAAVADKIKQRDASCLIINDHKTEVMADEDDLYAAYKIPDDLMW